MSRISTPASSNAHGHAVLGAGPAKAKRWPPGFSTRRHSAQIAVLGTSYTQRLPMKARPYGGYVTIASTELFAVPVITSR